MAELTPPPDQVTPVVEKLAERLGVPELPPEAPQQAVEYVANDGRRWDLNQIQMAFLDRVDVVDRRMTEVLKKPRETHGPT